MTWYEFDNTDFIDTPALLFYKTRIQQNIESALSINTPANLRPHIKTNKTKEVCQMMMAAGIEKFKCATIAEGELLGMVKAKDVLVAYQPVGPKIKRLLNLIKAYPATHYSCLVDNVSAAKELARVFNEAHATVTIWIDINSGMNRTGINPEAAMPLLDAILQMPAIDVAGFHLYDGHIVETCFETRQQRTDDEFTKIDGLINYFTEKTKRWPTIVAGGSPTFRNHVKRNVECSPGTFVFWDMGYKNLFPDEPFVFSALVITRIVSVVNSTTITSDLGYKSVASENPLPRVYFLNAPEAKPVFQNEEHLVLDVPDSMQYIPGDILYGVPEHICPTVALYDEAFVIENNHFSDRWEISGRKRMINY